MNRTFNQKLYDEAAIDTITDYIFDGSFCEAFTDEEVEKRYTAIHDFIYQMYHGKDHVSQDVLEFILNSVPEMPEEIMCRYCDLCRSKP